MVQFSSYELPVAYSMIAAAKQPKAKSDRFHPFEKYSYYWMAFNNIYTTIAFTGGRSTSLKKRSDGTVETRTVGNVVVPKVATVSERVQIDLAYAEFDNDLKHRLIAHPNTIFFVNRVPVWQGTQIKTDRAGQHLNGVINVNYTVSRDYPVWSPIDRIIYDSYIHADSDEQTNNFLARQIVDMLYTIRCNLMHGGKRYDDANDVTVVEMALPLLELIVFAFTREGHIE